MGSEGWQTLVLPTLPGAGIQDLGNSVSSLRPGASETRFSTRAGSSAVTGSNQKRGAFSPRRRDPRCKKTQPANRAACVAPRCAPPCSRSDHRASRLLLIEQEIRTSPFSFGLSYFSLLSFPTLIFNFCMTQVLLFQGCRSGKLGSGASSVPDPGVARRAALTARSHSRREALSPGSHGAAVRGRRRGDALGADLRPEIGRAHV